MITNERAYGLTRAAAAKFRTGIAEEQQKELTRARRLHIEAMQTQLAELERELKAYDRMKRGDATIEPRPLAELGQVLTHARIARGWTQRALGDRVGVSEQQIQNYEQTGYARASLTKLRELELALGATVTATIELVTLPADFTTSAGASRSRSGSRRRRPRRRPPASVSS